MGTAFLSFSSRPRSASDVGRALLLLEDVASVARPTAHEPPAAADSLLLLRVRLDAAEPLLEFGGAGSNDLLAIVRYALHEPGTVPAFDRALLALTDGLGVGERYEWLRLGVHPESGEEETITLDSHVRHRLRSVDEQARSIPPTLVAANDSYWSRPSIGELADRQGVRPLDDPSVLFDAEATDEERDAFMAAIAELR